MRHLVFHQFGGRRGDMCRLSIDYNRGSLHGRDIKLEGGCAGLVPIKRVYIGMLVKAGMGHISKSFTV
jgi:hypothetical protein